MSTEALSDILKGGVSAFSAGGGSSAWDVSTKASDETSATTTMVDDAALRFTMLANTKYRFRLTAYIQSLAAADLKIGLNGPASPTLLFYKRTHNVPVAAAGTYTPVSTLQTAYADLAAITHAVATGLAVIDIDGIVHNGANAGDCIFRWACNTATAGGVICRAGSHMLYKSF